MMPIHGFTAVEDLKVLTAGNRAINPAELLSAKPRMAET